MTGGHRFAPQDFDHDPIALLASQILHRGSNVSSPAANGCMEEVDFRFMGFSFWMYHGNIYIYIYIHIQMNRCIGHVTIGTMQGNMMELSQLASNPDHGRQSKNHQNPWKEMKTP